MNEQCCHTRIHPVKRVINGIVHEYGLMCRDCDTWFEPALDSKEKLEKKLREFEIDMERRINKYNPLQQIEDNLKNTWE